MVAEAHLIILISFPQLTPCHYSSNSSWISFVIYNVSLGHSCLVWEVKSGVLETKPQHIQPNTKSSNKKIRCNKIYTYIYVCVCVCLCVSMRCCEFTTATHILFYFLRSLSRYRAHGKLWKLPRSLRFAFRLALGQSIEVLWRRANAYCDVILTDCSRIVMSFREYISQVILEISQNLCHRKDIFKDQSFRSVRSIDFILTNSLYQIYVSPIS